MNETTKVKLDRSKFDQIATALGRLEDIRELSVVAKTRQVEAEALGLVEFLSVELLAHAAELLGCWYVVKAEYEPLIHALVPVCNRANSLIAAHRAPLDTNIIPLKPDESS